jgi:signal transduction histidine kinase
VRLCLQGEGTGARLSVIDSGPGIPAGEREAVLQRFYRAEGTRQLPGSGLGLSIVSAIVRLHGFRLDAGGTRVTLHCQRPALSS